MAASERDYWPTDGWRTSTPEEHGLDSNILAGIHEFGLHTDPPANGYVVTRHGYIVYEEYFRGYHEGSFNSVNSVTKSVMSMLIGIGLKKGLLSSVDQPIAQFFPECHLDDERKGKITIRHLLTMTSGFSRETAERVWPMDAQDPVSAILERPLEHEPGSHFFYDDAVVQLLSILLTRITGMSAAEFACTELFEPLGIWTDQSSRFLWRTNAGGPHTFHPSSPVSWPENGLLWKCDRRGNSIAAYGLHLTLREMAKLGCLYLNEGRWGDRQIVDAGYVRESTEPQNDGGPPVNRPYGFLWWMARGGASGYTARGFGFQQIRILPKEDIVVACATTPKRLPTEISFRFITPAILDR
ncbi:MAG TPA: serine hydrolase [Chloroflexota bacterium]|nr:serine hydrolase [Chloroflexota bacterium]